jgi:hypothetical protein
MTNPKIAPWQAVFRTIDESGYKNFNHKRVRSFILNGAPVFLHLGSIEGVAKPRFASTKACVIPRVGAKPKFTLRCVKRFTAESRRRARSRCELAGGSRAITSQLQPSQPPKFLAGHRSNLAG